MQSLDALPSSGACPDPTPPVLSVVVPALDEAANLPRLVAEVRAALDAVGLTWELLVVDDGSADETPAVLAALAAAEPRVRPLRHAERLGQTAALATGFRAARGVYVATLDADLQCAPASISRATSAFRPSSGSMSGQRPSA